MKAGARIMGLDNPEKKMSKSAKSAFNRVELLDDPQEAKKKIMRATTDTGSDVIYDIELEYLLDEQTKEETKIKTNKGKQVKVSEKLFDYMVNEGLIKKTEDGYIFIGDYKDLIDIKKK